MKKSLCFFMPVGLLFLVTGISCEPESNLQAEAAARQTQKAAAETQQEKRRIDRAVAVLHPIGGSGVSGVVYFVRQSDGRIEVRGEVAGLEPGLHGFHVHEYGDLTNLQTGESAGGHYDPTDSPHGRPQDEERHVGDLGNIEADSRGEATVDIRDHVIKLEGPHSILGRALVVHAEADQFTQPSGDAGDRVAFGIVGVAQPENKE